MSMRWKIVEQFTKLQQSKTDVFDIFKTAGANLVRVRLGIIQHGQIIQTLKMLKKQLEGKGK